MQTQTKPAAQSAQITIGQNILKAVSLVMSTEETRYYLNGVALVPVDGGLDVVATDGNRLIKYRLGDAGGLREAIIIPSELVKRAIALKLALKSEVMTLSYDGLAIRILCSTGEVIGKPVDGTFPDYNRVIPKTYGQVGEIGLNGKYLGTFGKAVKLVGGTKTARIKLIFGYDNQAPVTITCDDPRFTGVLMPMRV